MTFGQSWKHALIGVTLLLLLPLGLRAGQAQARPLAAPTALSLPSGAMAERIEAPSETAAALLMPCVRTEAGRSGVAYMPALCSSPLPAVPTGGAALWATMLVWGLPLELLLGVGAYLWAFAGPARRWMGELLLALGGGLWLGLGSLMLAAFLPAL